MSSTFCDLKGYIDVTNEKGLMACGKKSALTVLLIAAGSGSMAVFGDHNTRVETRGDNTAFRDFVRQGNGADSVNRFSTIDSRGREQQFSTRNKRATTTSAARGGRGRR